MTDSEDDRPGHEPAAEDPPDRQVVPGGSSRASSSSEGPPRSRRRDYDYDDDFDDDLDDPYYRPRSPQSRRDLTIVAGIAVAVLIAVLLVLLLRKDDKKNVAAGPGGSTQQSGSSNPSSAPGGLCPNWPGLLGGTPTKLKSGSGVFIWNDFQGFHVRAGGAAMGPITVKVTSDAPIALKPPAAGSSVKATALGNGVDIEVPAADRPEGADLNVSCDSHNLRFAVTSGRGKVAASKIFLGGTSRATSDTFTFDRLQS